MDEWKNIDVMQKNMHVLSVCMYYGEGSRINLITLKGGSILILARLILYTYLWLFIFESNETENKQ